MCKKTLYEIIKNFMQDLDHKGLDMLDERIYGHYAEFRVLEIACAINRLRDIKMTQK